MLAQRFSATAGTAASLSDGTATLEDGLLTQSAGLNGGFVVSAVAQNINLNVIARHLTIVGSSGASGFSLLNEGDGTGSSIKATATIRNSIIRGTNTPLQAQGTTDPSSSDTNTAAINIDYSDFHSAGDSTTGAPGKATIATGSHDRDVDPQFAGSSDYHLQSGSPVIDAADPASTGSSTTDLDGNLRAINGSGTNPCPNSGASQPCPDMGAYADMGAYEFKPAGNNAPVCGALHGNVQHNTATPLTVSCVDPDSGDTLTYAVITQPAHGALTNVSPNGHMTYTPNTGYGGQDSFTFRATDNHGATSNTATVTLDVAPNAVPTCSGQTVSVDHDTPAPITLTCSDKDSGDFPTYSIVQQPARGTLTAPDASGRVTYTPASGYSGADSFTFTGTDNEGASAAPQTVTLNVAAAPTFTVEMHAGIEPSITQLTPTSVTFHGVYWDGYVYACSLQVTSGPGSGVPTEFVSLEPHRGEGIDCASPRGLDAYGTRVVRHDANHLDFVYTVKGLTPGTTYRIQMRGRESGNVEDGGTLTFQTPPYPGLAVPTPTNPIVPPGQDPSRGGGSVGITQPVYNAPGGERRAG